MTSVRDHQGWSGRPVLDKRLAKRVVWRVTIRLSVPGLRTRGVGGFTGAEETGVAMRVWIAGAGYGKGEIVEEDQARIPVLDHGITVGDGVFETVRATGGRPFALTRHLKRLARSAEGLGMEEPDLGLRSEEHTSELQSRGHLVCRLLLEKKKKTDTIQR